MRQFELLSQFFDKKRCQWFGHQWMAGLKFQGAKIQGTSQICQRCGVCETMTKPIVVPSV